MHIHNDMFGYANAGWGLPSTQMGGRLQLAAGGDSDGDADGSTGGAQAAGAGRANPIMQALAEALQSLGLSLTSGTSAPAASGSAATAGSASAAAGSTTATAAPASPASAPTTASGGASLSGSGASALDRHEVHTIARDIRHVMRALFNDIQAENTLAPASPVASAASASSAAAASSQSSFGSGLAALISQIQGGSVPANLASAFDKLVSDLEQIGGVSVTGGASGAPVSPSATPAASGASPAAATAPASTATTTSAATSAAAATASAAATAPASPAPPAAPPSGSSTTNPTSPAASAPGGVSYQSLLLQFLTNLQSDLGLGYGASSSAPAQGTTRGLMVNTLA